MATPVVEMRVLIPKKVADKLEKIEQKLNIRKEDLILRALLEVIERYGG